MKKISFLLLMLISVVVLGQNAKTTTKRVVATAPKSGIVFYEAQWAKVLAKAKKEKKLIFFDAYTSWCGPCKRMQREVFTQPDVGAFFNKNFISVKVDMEAGEGPALAARYPIEAYPKLFILNAKGEIVQSNLGAIPAEKLIAFGRSAMR